ncbi:metal-sensing transcriptional repressor [Criibacterium bergeronii]|uniref:Metal-sensing transcriptional repressor n=1 Tax=Criibacterium bergeronii TaxID=1871336 RepID=A0A552V8V8_9FIRM|nr:metal-sensing transcriptional repressor [Criibacterium bergeronii]TRW26898.1 metal-sensing transcriptional repressor [Criibacterium bergeronii]
MKADYKKIRRKLNIAIGQLEGVSKMVDENRYCIDISNQLLAVCSALKGINNDILSAHYKGCVMEAIKNQEEIEKKMDEFIQIITKLNK